MSYIYIQFYTAFHMFVVSEWRCMERALIIVLYCKKQEEGAILQNKHPQLPEFLTMSDQMCNVRCLVWIMK